MRRHASFTDGVARRPGHAYHLAVNWLPSVGAEEQLATGHMIFCPRGGVGLRYNRWLVRPAGSEGCEDHASDEDFECGRDFALKSRSRRHRHPDGGV